MKQILIIVLMMLISCSDEPKKSPVEILADNIVNFAHGGTGTLMVSIEGNTIIVTGNVTDANKFLILSIDENLRVVWKAKFSGGGFMNDLISVKGKGIFAVADDAEITATGGGDKAIRNEGTVKISGGMVNATNEAGYAVFNFGSLEVSGGEITGAGVIGKAIHNQKGNVTISDGTVKATGKAGFAIWNEEYTKITGGIIISTGFLSQTIQNDGTMEILNGVVSATGQLSEAIRNSGTLNISDDADINGKIVNDGE